MDPKELFKEAQILLMRGNHAESIDAFTRAIKAGSEPFIAYLSRGTAHLQMKQPDKAVEDFTVSIKANDGSPRAFFYRGMAYMMKDEYALAVSDFDRAIELKTDYGAAYFARGTCHAHLGDDETASKDLKTAISYSEAAMQGFTDTFGILRTQFDGVLALLSGDRQRPEGGLTEKETEQLKKWLDE